MRARRGGGPAAATSPVAVALCAMQCRLHLVVRRGKWPLRRPRRPLAKIHGSLGTWMIFGNVPQLPWITGRRTAVSDMTLPNDASVGLHRVMGFEPVGVFRGVGWKHGQWHDVAWMQRPIAT